MQIGMVGLGRMGGNMTRRLLRRQHECVVFDANALAAKALTKEGAVAATSLADLVARLRAPRAVWLMLPAAIVNSVIAELEELLQPGDVIIDGGNSDYRDAITHASRLKERQLDLLDVGVSGGVFGLEVGYCLMIGGATAPVKRLTPIFEALATPGGESSATPPGYLHCGPTGAGHFVKMVHNGIEYGLMAAYAEGFNLLRHADRGLAAQQHDAETAPLGHPENYQFSLDVAAIAELWRHGSVVRSWLLDLGAQALKQDPQLQAFKGHVSDSGEGRWTLQAGIELGVPMPQLASALFERFASRGLDEYAGKFLAALRQQFGGHNER